MFSSEYRRVLKFLIEADYILNKEVPLLEFRLEISRRLSGSKNRIEVYLKMMTAWGLISIDLDKNIVKIIADAAETYRKELWENSRFDFDDKLYPPDDLTI